MPKCSVPIEGLLDIFQSSESNILMKNFALIYLEGGIQNSSPNVCN